MHQKMSKIQFGYTVWCKQIKGHCQANHRAIPLLLDMAVIAITAPSDYSQQLNLKKKTIYIGFRHPMRHRTEQYKHEGKRGMLKSQNVGTRNRCDGSKETIRLWSTQQKNLQLMEYCYFCCSYLHKFCQLNLQKGRLAHYKITSAACPVLTHT